MTKAKGMLGVGPIKETTMKYFEKKTGSREKARVEAVRELLNHQLDFNAPFPKF